MNKNAIITTYRDVQWSASIDFYPNGMVTLELYLNKEEWLPEKYKIVWVEINFWRSDFFSLCVLLTSRESYDEKSLNKTAFRYKTNITKEIFESVLLGSVALDLATKDEDISKYNVVTNLTINEL